MSDVFLAQDDGTPITLDDGSLILLDSYQPPPPPAPPAAPAYSIADFTSALLALLPRGPVWPRESGAVLPQVAMGLAPTYARMTDRAAALLQDAPTGTLSELLPEWEATLGLPDPCAGLTPTLQQRRSQVRAAIGARGGQSIPDLVAYAAALGFKITVDEFRPSISGRMRSGDHVASAGWAHVWRVTAPATVVTSFRSGASASGERLRSWGSSVLECALNRVKPAHTVLQFAYIGDPSGAPLGAFVLGRNILMGGPQLGDFGSDFGSDFSGGSAT